MRTRVKFCGMTQVEDAIFASELGVDAIGLIFVPDSPRFVSIAKAEKIVAALPPWVTTVAVFVNADKHTITEITKAIPIDLLQFHGSESVEFCQQFQKPYIKTIHMHEEVNLAEKALEFKLSKGLLLDTYDASKYGGTGKTFSWTMIPTHLTQRIILSGGLNSENIAAAISQVKPYGVDVTGGIEASPGKKDNAKMIAFIQEVHYADQRSKD